MLRRIGETLLIIVLAVVAGIFVAGGMVLVAALGWTDRR